MDIEFTLEVSGDLHPDDYADLLKRLSDFEDECLEAGAKINTTITPITYSFDSIGDDEEKSNDD